jgi:hypothetical protein
MMLTFLVCMAGIALLWVTLVKLELVGKRVNGQISKLQRLGGEEPAGSSTGRRVSPQAEV